MSIACSAVWSETDQMKHQISALLTFMRGIHRCPMNSHHRGPVKWNMLPFDDVIMDVIIYPSSCIFSGDSVLIPTETFSTALCRPTVRRYGCGRCCFYLYSIVVSFTFSTSHCEDWDKYARDFRKNAVQYNKTVDIITTTNMEHFQFL